MKEFNKTHHGKFLGVPVWLDMTDEDCPSIWAKYGFIGEFSMDVMEAIFGVSTWIKTAIDPYYEPVFPIQVGEKVNHED